MEIEYSLNEIEKVAQHCIENAKHKSLLFYAEMGVGKTTLIKKIVKLLGSKDEVSSPTFSIVNEYESTGFSIYHFDFYRINHEEEVYDIGFEDYFYQAKDWQFMEWPELIPNLLPEAYTKIEIELLANGNRKLKLTNSN
ncbi:tRNA (adenosine(37)-N6)-threonylcarbamoyltransferase complex ATPase subunit type 1 TsaE [Psychroflexus salis]|uniref:tRNA threonylcarbamoyladenosine biosynthesis protein TsaE n=1 Tax=Psychroflexus salis TaxID=1526574 RepID=A0A917E7E7_9FLAO|nr:tRNA (adenosine(37)-N6)-threonylcarbamoyltransferase complex ATPase subunit type 1 TsaE [Psychroflexus salis]GGE07906.1 tRNA (adenosine(37)-N6)-threonylcarbamoyltransferase complex ATPase subunit type 1 TsaE [Psychroflexus salis]